jgi:hypothetical protein
LLPDEGWRDFEAICQATIDHIQPETNLEWLWILISSSCRGRSCGTAPATEDPSASGVTAIEPILWRLDAAGMPKHAPCKLASAASATTKSCFDR